MVDITNRISDLMQEWQVLDGICMLFIPHCSASLIIQESFDPSARRDMETYLEKIAPENQHWMEHTLEGSDDSSAHLRAMLLPTSLTIPVDDGRLSLGTWQGIYLVEHRSGTHQRKVMVRVLVAQ